MPPPTSHRSPERFQISGPYVLAGILAWLIPGAGHWLLGKRLHAIVLATCILGLFWAGELLALSADSPGAPPKPLAVSREINPVFYACQLGSGLSTLTAQALWGEPRYSNETMRAIDTTLPQHLGLGILFTSISGLLNYLLILHVLDPRTWAARAGCPPGSPTSPAPGKGAA